MASAASEVEPFEDLKTRVGSPSYSEGQPTLVPVRVAIRPVAR